MEITGRLTADARVNETKSNKKVVGFNLAINDTYRKDGETKKITTYVDCSYWRGEGLAPYLRKGLLVQLYGYMTARPWVSRDGEPMASPNFHTNEITLLGASAKPQGDGAKSTLTRQG